MSHLVDILKAMTGQSDSDKKEDDVTPNGVGSSHPLLNSVAAGQQIKIHHGNYAGGVIGSSGFSGFSGLSGYSGYTKQYYTKQEMIESFIAGYKAFQLIEEDVKPEIIEMAKKHVATKY